MVNDDLLIEDFEDFISEALYLEYEENDIKILDSQIVHKAIMKDHIEICILATVTNGILINRRTVIFDISYDDFYIGIDWAFSPEQLESPKPKQKVRLSG